MLPKGHDRVAAILLRLKGSKGDDRDEEEDTDEEKDDKDSGNAGLEAAMDDFLKAMSDEDPCAMAEALCDFLHIHEGCEGPEDEGDE